MTARRIERSGVHARSPRTRGRGANAPEDCAVAAFDMAQPSFSPRAKDFTASSSTTAESSAANSRKRGEVRTS